MGEKRPRSFYVLALFFTAYVLFLYGPMFAIYILSFQGPDGGLTFPMNGVSLAGGMASRKPFRGATVLFCVAIASLIMPSIVTSLGIGLEFRLLDDFINSLGVEGWTTGMGLFTSGLGAHL